MIKTQKTDFILFLAANLFNILTSIILFARPFSIVFANVSFLWVCFVVIVAAVLIYNFINRRQWWTITLPALFLIFLVTELLFDYILQLNFRQTVLLWPYLLSFYIGQFAMIGYSFAAFRRLGFVTLATYFLTLAAALFEASA